MYLFVYLSSFALWRLLSFRLELSFRSDETKVKRSVAITPEENMGLGKICCVASAWSCSQLL